MAAMNTERKNKMYIIERTCGASGYSFREDTNKLSAVKMAIKKYSGITERLTIFDTDRSEFVYYKRALSWEPETNLIGG